jgi:two-component system chemotaxis response regulator CheB
MAMVKRKIRVLVVDDSALVRTILSQGLAQDPWIEVVGAASDPYVARDMMLTLDVEMPRMDGIEFLRRLMPQYPLPVVMVSALTQKGKRITIEALEAGAVDVVQKPSANVAQSLSDMMMELRTKVKIASTANVSHWKTRRPDEKPHIIGMTKSLAEATDKVVVIGASTGGTEAIRRVIERFPAIAPGIVIVQHMPAGFTRAFAERLNMLCLMEVKEAESGDRIMPGRILIAPGDYHLTVRRSGAFYSVECLAGEKVNGHCPSVDVLMLSVAEHVGANAVGVMLTGMGHDGAEGMLEMRRAGARTIAQDEQSCIVFGMPKCAYDRGGAESLVPLDKIAQTVLSYI